ncbi:MAG TPA: hypothetical protein VNU01_13275 [Egibacteraceae bacterium]|nr:hypothetical protein [Egibacteraceae bacterium]
MMNSDPFEELARDPGLRWADERYRAELRAEAEEYERLAAKDLLRGRNLQDVVRELCHRGDIAALVLDSRTLVGEIVYAAGDLARVRTLNGDIDVNLRGVTALRVVERSLAGGRSCLRGPTSFTARLFEHESAGDRVELSTRMPTGEVIGRIHAVAIDHVVVTDDDGQFWYVPLSAIDCVADCPI